MGRNGFITPHYPKKNKQSRVIEQLLPGKSEKDIHSIIWRDLNENKTYRADYLYNEYQVQVTKQELIKKGFDEKQLDEFIQLCRNAQDEEHHTDEENWQ